MSRRIKSLHHNLGDNNVIFHREHRSKKGRKFDKPTSLASKLYRKRKEDLKYLQTE